jgi:hypothetical protein
MQNDISLFLKLFLFRLLVGLLVNVSEHPDEYWQCQEPAYHFVYGRGNLTYEWGIGMRSYVFLLPYILGMALAKYVRSLESHLGPFAFLARDVEDWLLWYWRPLVAVFIAAVIDLYTLKAARKFIAPGKILDRWVLLLMATNSGLIHGLVRSYSNCTEAMLSLVALHLWPMKAAEWSRKYVRESGEIINSHSVLWFRKFGLALLIVGWACLVRISALQGWIFPVLAVLSFAPFLRMLSVLIPAVLGTLAFGLAVDRIGYGRWIVTSWNFLYWNVWRGISVLFGTDPPEYYLKYVATFVLGGLLPAFGIGLWQAAKRARSSKEPLLFPLTHFALPTLACLSAIGHKEPRFALPIVPVLLIYCAYGLQQMHLFVQKRHPLLKGLFWAFVIMCTGQQLNYGYSSMQRRVLSYKKMIRDVQDILDYDTDLDRSEHCNGGVSIFATPSRGPGMSLLNRPVPLSVANTFPLVVESLLRLSEEEKEYHVLVQDKYFEPILRNMQMRGNPMPAVLVITVSHLLAHGASLKILDGAGYRKCGEVELEYAWIYDIYNGLFGSYLSRPKITENLVDGLIFCKYYDTLIPNNYRSWFRIEQ